MDDVMPFLRNVTRGRNIPDDRLREVAHHYELFGGVSPINQQNRDLILQLKGEFEKHEIELPIYWGNRNWRPMLADTVREMKSDGVKRAIAFVTSAFSSYSGCRQYIEDIERARSEVGEGAPLIDKIPPFYDQPGFLDACEARLGEALSKLPQDEIESAHVIFTAHSIPSAMAAGCRYEHQLLYIVNALATQLRLKNYTMAYQSRSGPPTQPWLEPDVCDVIKSLAAQGVRNVIIDPIGFVSDHMEIMYDLDTEARAVCDELGMNMVRAGTVGTHRSFVRMIRCLVRDRVMSALMGVESARCDTACCPSGRPTIQGESPCKPTANRS
jgi:ferrochelatase